MSHSDGTQTEFSSQSGLSAEVLTGLPLTVRVSPHSYFAALLLGTFLSAFLFYLEYDAAGLMFFIFGWIILPAFALSDKVAFDGKRIYRTGIVPRFWVQIAGGRRRLKLTDIEQVETQAVRTMRRGGKVYYRYRTNVRGKGLSVAIVSGGEDFRRMIREILRRLPENVLDNRSIELRDHLEEPKEILRRAEIERLPSSDTLERTFSEKNRQRPVLEKPLQGSRPEDSSHLKDLRGLANELRILGHLSQSLEVFRRALRFRPADPRLIFEYSRCLQSFAGLKRDETYKRKAVAVMRLAERRAADDDELLARLGEAYFQVGEWKRAAIVFRKSLDRTGENFRSALGLAEIALREGKIAHVIHHFSTANRLAKTPSLRRWANGEAQYFSRLNSDDEYMEMEVGRVNLLEKLESGKNSVLRIGFVGLPAILAGVIVEDFVIANVGWAVSAISFVLWGVMILGEHMLSGRIPYDMIESDD